VNPPFDPLDANNHLHHVVTYWRQLSRITTRMQRENAQSEQRKQKIPKPRSGTDHFVVVVKLP